MSSSSPIQHTTHRAAPPARRAASPTRRARPARRYDPSERAQGRWAPSTRHLALESRSECGCNSRCPLSRPYNIFRAAVSGVVFASDDASGPYRGMCRGGFCDFIHRIVYGGQPKPRLQRHFQLQRGRGHRARASLRRPALPTPRRMLRKWLYTHILLSLQAVLCV